MCLAYVSTPSKNEGKFCNTTNRHALLVWSLLAPYQLVLGGFVLIYGSSVATICLKENTKKKTHQKHKTIQNKTKTIKQCKTHTNTKTPFCSKPIKSINKIWEKIKLITNTVERGLSGTLNKARIEFSIFNSFAITF